MSKNSHGNTWNFLFFLNYICHLLIIYLGMNRMSSMKIKFTCHILIQQCFFNPCFSISGSRLCFRVVRPIEDLSFLIVCQGNGIFAKTKKIFSRFFLISDFQGFFFWQLLARSLSAWSYYLYLWNQFIIFLRWVQCLVLLSEIQKTDVSVWNKV